jgi:hypothetical protein
MPLQKSGYTIDNALIQVLLINWSQLKEPILIIKILSNVKKIFSPSIKNKDTESTPLPDFCTSLVDRLI